MGGDLECSPIVGLHIDLNFQPFGWQCVRHAIGPLDEYQRGSNKAFLGPQSLEFVVSPESISIKVIDGAGTLVFLAQNKCRTDHIGASNTAARRNRLHQSRFSRPQGALE